MLDADADHPFGRGKEAQDEERRIELVAALAQFVRGDTRDQLLPLDPHLMHVHRVQERQVLRHQPVAIAEFHGKNNSRSGPFAAGGVTKRRYCVGKSGKRLEPLKETLQSAATIFSSSVVPAVLRGPVTERPGANVCGNVCEKTPAAMDCQ